MSDREPRIVTPRQLLEIREAEWRPRLLPGSLAAEYTSVSAVDTEQTLQALGRLYQGAYGQDRERRLRSFPAVQVLAMSQAATQHYAHGTFWPPLCELAGVVNDGNTQKDWGSAFLRNLATLGLPTFDDADSGARFVGRILMHSGVPTYCLGDYFLLIARRRRSLPGLEPAEFISWAVERVEQGRLPDVDKPVQRFLRYGGDFALDVTDRVFELLDVVTAGGNSDSVPLPPRFAEAAVCLRDELLATTSSRAVRQSRGQDQPHVHLDVYGRGPVLRLPSVPDTANGSVTWLVTMDGVEERVTSASLWPGYLTPAPRVDVPIARPVRLATAVAQGMLEQPLTLPVINDFDPLLPFDEDGRELRTSAALPGGVLWLLFPGELDKLVVDGELDVKAHGVLPPGWSGWTLVLVDLSEVTAVRLQNGRPHPVRSSSAQARVVMPPPVPVIRTMDGEPVVAQRPHIEIPETEGIGWDVSILDEYGEALAQRRQVVKSEEAGQVWDDIARPCAGRFTIKVRGPWGRGTTRSFVMVEGLGIAASPPWRRMTGSGLAPATAVIEVADEHVAGPARMDLDSRTTQLPLSIDLGPESMRFMIQIPHMSVSHVAEGGVSAPSITGLTLTTEGLLADPGSLVVEIGAEAEPTLHVLAPDGMRQVIRSKGGNRGQAFRFDLREVTDTLAANKALRIALDPEGALVVATVRPQSLHSGVSLQGRVLAFTDCADIEGLTAHVYRAWSPWRSAASIPVAGGTAELTDELIDAGPMFISVRVEDPWVPDPVPSWPSRGGSRLVMNDGYPTDDDATAVALSRFLAGEDEELTGDYRLDGRTWLSLDRLRGLPLEGRHPGVHATLVGEVLRRPREALLHLATSSVTIERMPVLLIQSGLAWRNLPPSGAPSAWPAWSRRTALGLGLLGIWHEDDEDAVAEVIAVCSDVVVALLAGTDPSPRAGSFDLTTDQLAKMPPEVRSMVVASAGLVPRGLLHADNRALAASILLESRDLPLLRSLRGRVHTLLRQARSLIAEAGCEEGARAVRARLHPEAEHGWRAMPPWSLAMAVLARLIAHNIVEEDRMSEEMRGAWEEFAMQMPEFVTMDLLLAELHVHRSLASRGA